MRKKRSDYRRNRRRESGRVRAAYLIRSEAVAKFSSFRQLRFSTIRSFSAVTCITSARDAGQQGFVACTCCVMRCLLQQRGDADRITAWICVKSLISREFECCNLLLLTEPAHFLLRYSSEVGAVFPCRLCACTDMTISNSLTMHEMRGWSRLRGRYGSVWSGDCLYQKA